VSRAPDLVTLSLQVLALGLLMGMVAQLAQ